MNAPLLSKQEKLTEAAEQINEIIEQLKPLALNKLKRALNSGVVPDYFMEADSHLLALAIVDSLHREQTGLSIHNKKWLRDIKNIHISV